MPFELAAVTVRFPAATPLVDVSATIGSEPTAIMGPSGSGKTTLLRILSGLLRPTSGRVSLATQEIRRATWTSGSDPRIAVVYQDYKLVDFLSIADNLLLAAEMRGLTKSPAHAEKALSTVGLDHLNPTRLPATLSGGEQQRVAIARAVICEAEALIADEPTGALDASTTDLITDLLLSMAIEASTIVVVATHDPRVADRMPARFEMQMGQLRRVR